MPEDTHLVGTVIKCKYIVTRAKGEDMAMVDVYSPKGIISMIIFPREWQSIRQILFVDETYIFKYKMNPPRDDFPESYQVLAVKASTNFKPESLVITDVIGYSEDIARSLPTLPSGDIEVIYEGDDISAFKTKRVGYLNILTSDILKSLPARVEYKIHAF